MLWAWFHHNRPDPLMDYAVQEIGIYDGHYEQLEDADCRNCHGDYHYTGSCIAPDSGCHNWEQDIVYSGNPLWHHNSVDSGNLNCTAGACHDDTLIAAWTPPVTFAERPPAAPTPRLWACSNCHWEQDITASGHPRTDDHEYGRKIYSNKSTHHMKQMGNVYPQCDMACHTLELGVFPPFDPNDPEIIRACESCHTMDTLHSIHITGSGLNGWEAVGFHVPFSNNDDTDLEPGTYRVFSDDEICVSCHAGPAVIDKLRPLPKEYAPGKVIRIIGSGFRQTQGNSVVYIGKTDVFDSTSPSIKLWTDTKIRIRIPSYRNKDCEWYKHGDGEYRRRKVWVTVGGQESNRKTLRVMKPGEQCP